MNIYDVAKKANTSTATVSRVLNGKTGVSEKTRTKILKIMDDLGYVPNGLAQGLSVDSLKMVGVLCYDISDIYCAEIVSLLEKLLRANGYDMLLCCTGDEEVSNKKYFDILLSKRVDAIFLVSSKYSLDVDNEYIARVSATIPVLLLNSGIDVENVYSIVCDDRLAIEEAVGFLVSQGHRRIAYLHGELIFSGKRQLKGYMDGLAANGIEPDERLIVRNTFYNETLLEAGMKMTQWLLDEGVDFTAILVSDDPYAAGAIKVLSACGVRIPEDVEVIGYDNSAVCSYTTPELSSIDSNINAITKIAVQYFLNKQKGEAVPRRTVLTAELVHRGSTMT